MWSRSESESIYTVPRLDNPRMNTSLTEMRTNIQKLLFESSHTHLISAREGSAYIMSLRYNRVASFRHTHIWALYMSIRFHWIVRISYSDDYRLLKRYRNSCQSGIEGSTRRHDTGWTHGFHSKLLLLYIMIGFKNQKNLQQDCRTHWRHTGTCDVRCRQLMHPLAAVEICGDAWWIAGLQCGDWTFYTDRIGIDSPLIADALTESNRQELENKLTARDRKVQ